MNARKLWAYLLVLLVVAGVFIFSEFVFLKKTGEKETAPILKVTPGAIEEVRWQRGAEVIEVKKNKTWEIVQPLRAAADPLVLEGVLQGLSLLKAERSFQPSGGDLAEYGLNPPQTIISFSAQGRRQEVRIGAQATVGNARYFQASGSEPVHLVEVFSLKELDRDLLALREKKVFSLLPEQVEKVEIRSGPNNLEINRTEKGWTDKRVPGRLLSRNKVESFVGELLRVKARAFLDGEKEVPSWGLQAPSLWVRLTGGGGKTQETLIGGAETPDKGLYARSSRFSPALIIEGGLAGKVPADPGEWEEKATPPGSPTPKPAPQVEKKGS
ncbi:MAG: DUF4340 domain-containing protein [Desulfobacterota bacterium]|nr:DUF4340 domain-containing protein [Thermodesulfobacteriota bacterium]